MRYLCKMWQYKSTVIGRNYHTRSGKIVMLRPRDPAARLASSEQTYQWKMFLSEAARKII